MSQIELGTSKILLHLDYTKWGAILKDFWVKTFWTTLPREDNPDYTIESLTNL